MPIATFAGNRGWGYDGVYTVSPAPRLRRPGGLSRARRRRPRGRPGGDPRRRLQPHGRRVRRGDRVRPLHDRATRDLLGRRDRLLAAPRCASGRSRTRRCGCATTASTACGSTPCTRSTTTRRRHVLAELAQRVKAIDPGALAHLRDGDRRPAPDRARGATTRSGRTRCTTRVHVLLTGERDGYYAQLRHGRRPGARTAASRGPPLHRLRAEPRPGRQPGAGRSAARARSAPGRVLRDPLPGDADALPGRGVRRVPPLPVLHRSHRPRDRRADARGPPARVLGVLRLRGRGHPRPPGSRDLHAFKA